MANRSLLLAALACALVAAQLPLAAVPCNQWWDVCVNTERHCEYCSADQQKCDPVVCVMSVRARAPLPRGTLYACFRVLVSVSVSVSVSMQGRARDAGPRAPGPCRPEGLCTRARVQRLALE